MTSPVEKYGLRDFGDLQTSTMTVMIYTNVIFDMPKIFGRIDITEVEVPFTKKQKNVDKKKITAPYASVISVQSKTKIRGVDLRKKKKRWCTVCQPYKIVDDKESKIITVTEQLAPDTEPGSDAQCVIYYCSKCQKGYKPEEMKKINHFLNQLTVVISIGKQPLLNIMMFRDNLKVAGCKSVDDAVEAIMILWQDFIFDMKDAWRLKKGAKEPRFVFETVMRNVDFKLGFPIERPALNYLMNGDGFRDKIHMSQYESTGHTNVNIKMFSRKPADFYYDCLVMPLDAKQKPYFIKLKDIPYKSQKKKEKEAKEEKFITFIVFSSSEIILSGRYDKNMREMYEFFVNTVFENREDIEEKLGELNEKDLKKINRQKLVRED